VNAIDKARLLPMEPDPLAVALYRIMRLTMLPPAPAGIAAQLTIPPSPASDATIAQTAVPTVRPGRVR